MEMGVPRQSVVHTSQLASRLQHPDKSHQDQVELLKQKPEVSLLPSKSTTANPVPAVNIKEEQMSEVMVMEDFYFLAFFFFNSV